MPGQLLLHGDPVGEIVGIRHHEILAMVVDQPAGDRHPTGVPVGPFHLHFKVIDKTALRQFVGIAFTVSWIDVILNRRVRQAVKLNRCRALVKDFAVTHPGHLNGGRTGFQHPPHHFVGFAWTRNHLRGLG